MIQRNNRSLLVALAFSVLGAMTALGGGKVASYTSGDTIMYQAASDIRQAEAILGAIPKVPPQFRNGLTFSQGGYEEVLGKDESGTVIEIHPKIFADYNGTYYLNIRKIPFEREQPTDDSVTKEIGSISVSGYEMPYLFLPSNTEPSEADQALAALGELMISYGSDAEEREVSRTVTWKDDGLCYSLISFEKDSTIDGLMSMAEEVIEFK